MSKDFRGADEILMKFKCAGGCGPQCRLLDYKEYRLSLCPNFVGRKMI